MTSKRCAGCKYLRRRCPSTCILSPYFPPNDPQRFSYVHKIYGASNVAKMLQQVPVHQRAEAAESLYYEAYCRINDPVYGCVGIITILQQQIYTAQCELAKIEAELAVINNQSQTISSYDQLGTAPNSDASNSLLGGGNVAALPPFDPSLLPQFPWN